jgi:DNA-binding IclR family transcriptional regulator
MKESALAEAAGSDAGDEKDPQFAYTLARGLEVLRAFEAGPSYLTNREIAAHTGIPRPTVARLTRTLALLGYLRYQAETTRYHMTAAMLRLVHPLLAQLNIRRIARPAMQQLADYAHCAVSLGMRDGLDLVLIESCIDNNAVTGRPDIGASRDIATTAIGRAYVSAVEPDERAAIIAAMCDRAPQDAKYIKSDFDRALKQFRAKGFCTSLDTSRKGIHGVAVPMRFPATGEIIAFNCGVASFNLRGNSLEEEIAPRLMHLVQSVETALGQR